MQNLLSEIEYASFLCYAPYGKCNNSKKSVRIKNAVKGTLRNVKLMNYIMERLDEDIDKIPNYFTKDTVFIPVPRSSMYKEGNFFPSLEICKLLVKYGFGKEIITALVRTRAIQQSSTSKRGDRPNAKEHYETIAVKPFYTENNIMVVDDIISKGNTLSASVSKIKNYSPKSNIRAFALIRTKGFITDRLEKIPDPIISKVSIDSCGEAIRLD